MIELRPIELEWINGPGDDSSDQCAHAKVRLSINGTKFIKPEDGEWTVSASALYLLRSLEEDHDIEANVTDGNQLFPCCTFTGCLQENNKAVFFGCPNGLDVWIAHSDRGVTISSNLGEETISESDWYDVVLKFAREVEVFYSSSLPKDIPDDEEERLVWESFWAEFSNRVANASASES